jgi:hypothetical protein
MSWTIRGEYDEYQVDENAMSKGGVGSIHATTDSSWVYKRYSSPAKAPSQENLARLVDVGREVLVRQGLKPGDTPESSVNWPVDIQTGPSGEVFGVILPRIPAPLFNEFGDVRGLEFLVMKRAEPPPADGRVALLIRMAEVLAFIDARGLVHGDVNGKNLAWTTVPAPIMYLIDCDGMVPQSPPPRHGVQALGWTDPRLLEAIIPAHDHHSDWYALALAMYRGLALVPGKLDTKGPDGHWPVPSQIPAALPDRVRALLQRALADPVNGEARPHPREWVTALRAGFLAGDQFNTAALRALDAEIERRDLAPRFSQLPPVTPPSRMPSQPTTYPRVQVPPGPAPYRPPAPNPPPGPRPPSPQWQPTPPAPYPAPPSVNHYAPPPPRPQPTAPLGGLAARALEGGFAWYVKGFLASLFFWFVAIPYIGLALVQMRRAGPYTPGRRRAQISLYTYLGLAAFMALGALSSMNV